MQFRQLGTIPYSEAHQLQSQLVTAIAREGHHETVLLLEHPHVFTLGRSGEAGNLLAEQDYDGRPLQVERINRGGDVTYHGPGQLVAYPHLDLRLRGRDVHRYLRDLEQCILLTAADFGVDSFQREGLTGVWTREGKLASIGVGVRHWITMHGLALNVATDLRYFQLIHPCGLPDCPMVSLSSLLARPVSVDEVIPIFRRRFLEVFALAEV